MLSAREAAKLLDRADAPRRFWAPRRVRGEEAWRLLAEYAREGDPEVRDLLCRVATGRVPGHRRTEGAGSLIAEIWAETREPVLRDVVIEARALAGQGLARLQTAALLGRLGEFPPWKWVPEVLLLLADDDAGIRAGTAETCATATGPLLTALWAYAIPRRDVAAQDDPAGSSGETPEQLIALLGSNSAHRAGAVLDIVWTAWLRRPDDTLWSLLTRWNEPATTKPARSASLVVIEEAALLAGPGLRSSLIRAAKLRDHPLGNIARAKILEAGSSEVFDEVCDEALSDPDFLPFCVANGIAPKDPVRRVLFFLLTDQSHQYRGLDPDGRLLSLAYASADRSTRSRLRKAMGAAGSLDLVQVLAGTNRREWLPDMDEEELAYLARSLAGRGEWPQLWTMVQDLPLVTGVRLAGLFDGWSPPDADSRRVFDLMRGTDPQLVEAALADLRLCSPGIVHQARISFTGRVNSVSFAPDEPLLAVAGTHRVAGIVDLSEAKLVERYEDFKASVGHVLHLGGGAFLAAERAWANDSGACLVRCSAGEQRSLFEADVTTLALAGRDGRFAGGTRRGELLLGDHAGTLRAVALERLGMNPSLDWPRTVTAHLGSGRLAVLGRQLALTDAEGKVLARGTGEIAGRAVFTGPGSLVTAGKRGTVQQLTKEGDQLVPGAHNVGDLCGIVPLPHATGLILVDRTGRLVVVDAVSLQEMWSSEEGAGGATSADVSPGGEYLAVGNRGGFTDLYDLRTWGLAAFAGQPLMMCVPAQLGVVAAARGMGGFTTGTRHVVDLLHELLQFRFRFDIEVGGVDTLAKGEYDISL